MPNIPIRDIPLIGTPSPSSKMVFDDGQMKRANVSDFADAIRPVASQSEAQAGSDNAKTMTPLRTLQSIASQIGVSLQAYSTALTSWAGKITPDGSVVGTTDTQTLTNKVFDANLNTLTLANQSNNTLLANVSGSNGPPSEKTLTQVLDATIGSVQGAVMYRGASGWAKLDPGSPGEFLQTPGVGANPAWSVGAGLGDLTKLAADTYYAALVHGHQSSQVSNTRAETGGVAQTIFSYIADGFVTPQQFGAKADVQIANDGATSAGSNLINFASAHFVAGDVGKVIGVQNGAGLNTWISGTIMAVNSATQVQLNVSATYTGSGAQVYWGTNDGPAIQNALNAKKRVVLPWRENGYLVYGLVLTKGMVLEGERKQLIIAPETFAFIGGAGNHSDIKVRNLILNMSGVADTTSAGFKFRSSLGIQWRVEISDVDTIGAFAHSRQDTDVWHLFDAHFIRCRAYFARGPSFKFFNLQGYTFFSYCAVDYTDDPAIQPLMGTILAPSVQKDWCGFVFGGTTTSVGIQMEWSSVFGRGGTNGATANAGGVLASNVTSMMANFSTMDSVNGYGWNLNNCMHLKLIACDGFGCGEGCFNLTSVRYSQLASLKCVGTKGLLPAVGNANQRGLNLDQCLAVSCSDISVDDIRGHSVFINSGYGSAVASHLISDLRINNGGQVGLYLSSTDRNMFSNVSIAACGSDGVAYVNATRNVITGLRSAGNGGWGRNSTGTANYNVVSGAIFEGNTSGNLNQAGAGEATYAYVNNSGTPVIPPTGIGAGSA